LNSMPRQLWTLTALFTTTLIKSIWPIPSADTLFVQISYRPILPSNSQLISSEYLYNRSNKTINDTQYTVHSTQRNGLSQVPTSFLPSNSPSTFCIVIVSYHIIYNVISSYHIYHIFMLHVPHSMFTLLISAVGRDLCFFSLCSFSSVFLLLISAPPYRKQDIGRVK
jgi:hypothetical protein